VDFFGNFFKNLSADKLKPSFLVCGCKGMATFSNSQIFL
jgi:hypothetical protein